MKIKPALIISGVLAAAGAAGTIAAVNRGVIGSVHPLKNPKYSDIRVACVGDSITYGCGVKGWLKNSYPAVLSRLLGEGFCVNNYGFSARTASLEGDHPYEAETLYQQSLDFLPDIVVLMLGTNDSKPYNWKGAKVYTEDILRIVRAYQNHPTPPKVFLTTPLPAFSLDERPVMYDIQADVIAAEICPAVRKLAAEEGLELIDTYEVFSKHPELFWDGVHPNVQGAKVLAETVFKAVNQQKG